jgi:hypothetical protein
MTSANPEIAGRIAAAGIATNLHRAVENAHGAALMQLGKGTRRGEEEQQSREGEPQQVESSVSHDIRVAARVGARNAKAMSTRAIRICVQCLATRNAYTKALFMRVSHDLGRFLGSPNPVCPSMTEWFGK